jgi:hypothetical protein
MIIDEMIALGNKFDEVEPGTVCFAKENIPHASVEENDKLVYLGTMICVKETTQEEMVFHTFQLTKNNKRFHIHNDPTNLIALLSA